MDSTQVEFLLRQAEGTGEALLNALTDEVCLLDGSGRLVAANEAWKGAFEDRGKYLASTSLGEDYLDACRKLAAAGTPDAEKALLGLTAILRKTNDHFTMEYDWLNEGGRRWFLLTATSLANLPGALISHREITERRRAQEALRLSGEIQTLGPLFESFLPALVQNLATALHARHAFLTELISPSNGRAQLLSHWAGSRFGELFAYDTEGTPCEQVLAGHPAVFASGVQKLFPADVWLTEIEAESYVAVPLLDARGQVLGHLGVIDNNPLRDVAFAETTLRVFAARATPELERRMTERRLAIQSRLTDIAPDAIIGTDENLMITYWNQAAETTYGWTAKEAIGRYAGDVFRTDATAKRPAEIQRMMREPGVSRVETVQHRRDGSRVEIDATVMSYAGPDGGVAGFISINRDVTERKRAEEALRQSERNNQAILEAIPDMIFTLDGSGRFLNFKPAQGLQPLLPPSSFIGRHVDEAMPPHLAAAAMAAIKACLRSGQTETFVYELVEDGVRKNYEARVLPVGPDEVVAIVRDYTDERQRPDAGREQLLPAAPAAEASHVHVTRRERPRLLIVDQDVQSLRFLRRSLERAGNRPVVTSDAAEAVRLAEIEMPDLLLLDFGLPGRSGFDLLREIRLVSQAPIVVLIPAEREDEGVEALGLGVDDYIRKPVSLPELNARIEAAMRRRRWSREPVSGRIEVGDLVIDVAARVVTDAGEGVSLTPTEYRLLSELAAAAGRVLTHDEILARVWGPGYAGDYELLRTYVRSLRRKLGDGADQRRLRSERGVGYRLMRPAATS